MRFLTRAWAWVKQWRTRAPALPHPAEHFELPLPVQELNAPHRDRVMDIGPDAWIFSNAVHDIVLEGTVIKRLVIPAKRQVRIKSPVLELVADTIAPRPGKMMLREWDALHIAEQMIEEYCRGCWYDLADPEDLRNCTLPFPKRSLARIAEKIGLRAERESNFTQVGQRGSQTME
jgi:hypothetical protein